MIANRLKQFFTSCWLSIASLAPNGSTSTPKTRPAFLGASIAGQLKEVDRAAMKENLTNKYGITEIE